VTPVDWHILGAGALGCLFASALAQAGCPATLLLRPGCRETRTAVTVEREGVISRLELPVSTAAADGLISHLLVTTKAQDVHEAVLSVAHRLDASSQVLLLVNGLGFDARLRAEVAAPQYFYGTTTEGAYRLGPRHICHAGRGVTRIGQAGRVAAPDWFSQWAQAVDPSVWDPQIDESLWLKLAINCAINPLSALQRCRNGELASPQLAPRVRALCEEIMRVSAAAGFGGVTADLTGQVMAVIRATAGNRSSMLQDVLAGRPTEIEYITGHLLRVARQLGVAVPHNEAVYRSILTLDN
jgi:2-dehydropantoate 2-reductase